MDRDFSLAYFMRENNCFPEGADIKKIIDFYFQVIMHAYQFIILVHTYVPNLEVPTSSSSEISFPVLLSRPSSNAVSRTT